VSVFRKGEVWEVEVGSDRYRVLVISSDMFNWTAGSLTGPVSSSRIQVA
jgi:hypothetical protein